MTASVDSHRRRLLLTGATALGALALGHARGSTLVVTPPQSRGPFYPDRLPLDRDNDLVRVAGRAGTAAGEIAHVLGRVLDVRGTPVAGARIEIWQCDSRGRYLHSADARRGARDAAFQGFGHTLSAGDGAYRFRTIRPVPYPGRAPHIHFAVSAPGMRPLVTQMYVEGAPENRWDLLLNALAPPDRARLVVALEPMERGEWVGRFDLVLAPA